jgi:hypothetical protein
MRIEIKLIGNQFKDIFTVVLLVAICLIGCSKEEPTAIREEETQIGITGDEKRAESTAVEEEAATQVAAETEMAAERKDELETVLKTQTPSPDEVWAAVERGEGAGYVGKIVNFKASGRLGSGVKAFDREGKMSFVGGVFVSDKGFERDENAISAFEVFSFETGKPFFLGIEGGDQSSWLTEISAQDTPKGKCYSGIGIFRMGDCGPMEGKKPLVIMTPSHKSERSLESHQADPFLAELAKRQGSMNMLGQAMYREGQQLQAEYAKKSVKPEQADALLAKARKLWNEGDYSGSIKAAKEALTIKQKIFGPEHPEVKEIQQMIQKAESMAANSASPTVAATQVPKGLETPVVKQADESNDLSNEAEIKKFMDTLGYGALAGVIAKDINLQLFVQKEKNKYGISSGGISGTPWGSRSAYTATDVYIPTSEIRSLLKHSADLGHKAKLSTPFVFGEGWQTYLIGIHVNDSQVARQLLQEIQQKTGLYPPFQMDIWIDHTEKLHVDVIKR